MGGRDSDVDLTFIPFSLIFLISSVGFSANRMNVIIIQKQKDSDSKVTVQ